MYLGVLYAFAAASCYAGGNICVARGAARRRGDIGAMQATFVGALVAAILWLIAGSERLATANPQFDLGIVWFTLAGLSGTVFARTMMYSSIERVGVSTSVMLNRLNPFFAVVLASPILGVSLTGGDWLGIAILAAAIVLYARLRRIGAASAPSSRPAAWLFGIAVACGYAFANIARKLGLEVIADPLFGTMIAGLTGCLYYVVGLTFVADFRRAFVGMFFAPNGWQIVASLFLAAAQLLVYCALLGGRFETVVMVLSLEVFFSMLLSALLGLEPDLPKLAYPAAALAVAGALIIAVGG